MCVSSPPRGKINAKTSVVKVKVYSSTPPTFSVLVLYSRALIEGKVAFFFFFNACRENPSYKWSRAPVWRLRRSSQDSQLLEQVGGGSAGIPGQPGWSSSPRGHYPALCNNKCQKAQPISLNEQKPFPAFPAPSNISPSKGRTVACFLKLIK